MQQASSAFPEAERQFFASDTEMIKLLSQVKAFLHGEGTLILMVDTVQAVVKWQGENFGEFSTIS